MTKLEILKPNLAARDEEILSYQINIDNYVRAIQKIKDHYSGDPRMVEFRERLEQLLDENRTEQLKSQIIRDVIAEQVEELEAG